MTLKVGSLFSGIGGIEYGFEQARGFETVWFIEKDLHAQAILKKHWANAIIYEDVTTVDFTSVPKVDILTGGFPCQDISVAGKRIGITGSRSSLWRYYCKAISEIRPRYAFIENVSALLRRGLNVVLADLAEIGYDAEWYCVSASAVGAPHKRERVFIIAYPNSIRWDDGENNHRQDGIQGDKDRRVSQNQQSRTRWKRWFDEDYKARYRKIPKSYLHRNDDGFSAEMDRFTRLGNAVVPQCAEVFAKAIKEMMLVTNEKNKREKDGRTHS